MESFARQQDSRRQETNMRGVAEGLPSVGDKRGLIGQANLRALTALTRETPVSLGAGS